ETLDNVIPVANAEQVSMMSRGQIDAAWAPEPWGARLVAETGGKIIAEEKDLWPGKQFSLTVVVTTPKFLAEHPDVLEKLLARHKSWTAKLQTDPKGQLPQIDNALAELTGKHLPSAVLSQGLARVKFTDEPLTETLTTMGE